MWFQRSQPTRGGPMPANRDQLLSWQTAVYFNGFSASGQFEAAELIRNIITKPQRWQPDQTHLQLLDLGRCTSEPRPCYKVPLSSMYSPRHKTRSELQVHQMLWMGVREMFWNLKCSSVSEKKWLDMRHLLGPTVPAIATTNFKSCSAYRTDQWRQHFQRPTAQRNREQCWREIMSKWRWYRSQSYHPNPRTPASRTRPRF